MSQIPLPLNTPETPAKSAENPKVLDTSDVKPGPMGLRTCLHFTG
jgi:hypothetical protein